MAAITRLSVDGYGARRAGSFAGREEVIAVVEQTGGGGYVKGGWEQTRIGRPLTKKELRRLYGLEEEEAEIIIEVAQEQAKELEKTEKQRQLQLEQKLKQRQLLTEIRHLEALNEQRQRIIDAEIAKYLQITQIEAENEQFLELLMFAAAA